MIINSERGFTIIELMLFLAITGALFAALMIGVNSGITQQRYLDSVRSYKSLLQNQYSEVLNTRNSDDPTWKCVNSTTKGKVDKVENVDSGDRDPRGTSQCVILGRAISISNGGKTVTTASVTGDGYTVQDDSKDDIAVIKSFSPQIGEYDADKTEIDWGAYLIPATQQTGSSASTAVIVIVRSPATGAIRIFTADHELRSTDVKTAIDNGELSSTNVLQNCIKGDSGQLPKQLISIDPRIASPDAVSVDGGSNEVCQ